MFKASEIMFLATKKAIQEFYPKRRVFIKDILMEGKEQIIRVKFELDAKGTAEQMKIYDLEKDRFIV